MILSNYKTIELNHRPFFLRTREEDDFFLVANSDGNYTILNYDGIVYKIGSLQHKKIRSVDFSFSRQRIVYTTGNELLIARIIIYSNLKECIFILE